MGCIAATLLSEHILEGPLVITSLHTLLLAVQVDWLLCLLDWTGEVFFLMTDVAIVIDKGIVYSIAISSPLLAVGGINFVLM